MHIMGAPHNAAPTSTLERDTGVSFRLKGQNTKMVLCPQLRCIGVYVRKVGKTCGR